MTFLHGAPLVDGSHADVIVEAEVETGCQNDACSTVGGVSGLNDASGFVAEHRKGRTSAAYHMSWTDVGSCVGGASGSA